MLHDALKHINKSKFDPNNHFKVHKKSSILLLKCKFTPKILLQQSIGMEEKLIGKIAKIIKKYYFHPKSRLKSCNLLLVRHFARNTSGSGRG